ncbi:MAG: SoxR reducing system RseC family protein [Muribaculum sp.]|nr:SoxR reducing system RseC family protein [Muribaculum sp.]
MKSGYSAVHVGTVVSVEGSTANIEISPKDDCAACSAQSFCRTDSEISAPKLVEVDLSSLDKRLKKGDVVTVGMSERLHGIAVLLVFVIPTILLVATVLMSALVWNLSEGIAVAMGLGSVVACDLIVFTCFRQKIRKEYKWSVIAG